MLNGRLYRVTFVPFLVALGIAAFSLTARPLPLTSTLAPDAFDGQSAFAELKSLAAEFPARRPGSAGDDALAERVAHTLEGLGGAGRGGFEVRTRRFEGQTIDGERTLETVIAQRAGSSGGMSGGTPIVIMAHRDSSARGSQAELSGTVALLELARVFAARETQRTIVLVSTSGGSGGDAGALDFAANDAGPPTQTSGQAPIDAAIVLGDLAGVSEHKPFVVPYSDGFGSAPELLARTVAGAITQNVGGNPGAPSTIGQLAHLAFPFAVGEQGALNGAAIPSVLVQVSGERGPSPREAVSAERLEGFGRAVLSAVDALDTAPDIEATPQTGVVIGPKVLPEWALRLLLATLLFGPLLLGADGYARLRRRRGAIGDRTLARGLLWVAACALPFFVAALFARALGWLDVLHAAPGMPVPAGALPLNGGAVRALLAVVLVLALGWLAWPALVRRLGCGVRPDPEAAGLALLAAALGVGLVVWVRNPYTALLVVGALHLWLLVLSPALRPRRGAALALVALALAPLALLIAFYARELGVGPGAIAWDAVLLLAGGHIGVAAAALWSVAFGCAVAATLLALTPPAVLERPRTDGRAPVSIRGPLSYAGPGSLGGTEPALRR
jgi:hypothetical protein